MKAVYDIYDIKKCLFLNEKTKYYEDFKMMKKRILLLIVMVTMVGTLCACEKQSTGIVKMPGGKEQTAGEKEKVSDQNADQTVENNDVAQLPKNEENMVEMQPIENADVNATDDEIQVDYLEKTEEENSESSSENEDYPGEDVVEIVNLKGETTTVYKLADGRYMDRIERIFIFDGVDTWTDTNGAEWNQAVN